MNEIFVDTSGFYALLVRGDHMHERAGRLLRQAARDQRRFLTTDYVLDETATLLKSRGLGHLLPAFFDAVFVSRACRLEWMDPEQFERTRRFALKHADKPWSFTDCFSFCVMRERNLSQTLTKDRHFRQAGFAPLLIG